ncbi:hypothetical protein D3C77_605400 [compost metagenome]
MVDRALVELITTGRLNTDEGQAKTQTGDHHPPSAAHRVLFWLAPALAYGILVGLGQGRKGGAIVFQGHALQAGTQVKAVQIITDTTQQRLDQRRAIFGQGTQRIALILQGTQDVQRSCRRIQADPVADTPVSCRVIGQNQRHALVLIR